MKTRLAFYRGRKSENRKSLVGDWLICWVTASQFSHVELVAQTLSGHSSEVLSSSLRDGGVRSVWRTLYPDRWVVVEFDRDPAPALAYVRGRIGVSYGWLDLFSFLLPFRISTSADFCSEVVAQGLGLPDAWHTSPGDLYKWAEQQPGFRVLTADEFSVPWTAAA